MSSLAMCFINYPVKDLPRAKDFYAALGFRNNPNFTDETAACMMWSETIYVMLLSHARWADFDKRPISDGSNGEVMIAITLPERRDVDQMLATAIAHGGTADPTPMQEYPFMFSRSFTDLDGHIWEATWMNPSAMAEEGAP